MLHTVISGTPGVGKTTLAMILGKLYFGMRDNSKKHEKVNKNLKTVTKSSQANEDNLETVIESSQVNEDNLKTVTESFQANKDNLRTVNESSQANKDNLEAVLGFSLDNEGLICNLYIKIIIFIWKIVK